MLVSTLGLAFSLSVLLWALYRSTGPIVCTLSVVSLVVNVEILVWTLGGGR